MNNGDFETLLRRSLREAPCEENSLKKTILLAKAQAAGRYERKRIPFRHFLFRQIRCIGWQLWGSQALLLLIFDWMLVRLYGERFWDSPVSVARLLFCLSTLVAMMALPLLHRSRKYRMQEIESASYFSSARLLMAKLAVIGFGDLLLLAGMFLLTALRTSMQAGNLSFYLFFPFLVMSAAYLYMMGHCSGNTFFAGSTALGAAMLLFAVALPGQWLPLFRQGIPYGQLLFCAGLLTFCAEQLRYLLYHSSYAELQVS